MKYLPNIPFIRIWANLFVFKGKETFKEFLVDFLLYLLFAVGAIVGFSFYLDRNWPPSNLLVLIVFATYYVLVIPILSLTARRLFTVGTSWKFCFLLFIPFGGLFWAIITCLASRSQEEAKGKSYGQRVRIPMIVATVISPESVIDFFVIVFIVAIVIDFQPKIKNRVKDYQFIFDIVDTFKTGEKDIIGFGEYKYNSYLLLVPRKTPSTLKKFYYRWSGGIDVDDYGFYFECKLEQEKFDNYIAGLENFTIKVGDTTNKLVKTDDVFDYPTYVVQWRNVGPKWQVFEYIMLDEKENKAIYAFSMSTGYDEIIKKASYNIAPKNGVDIVPRKMDGFSIYRNPENNKVYKLDDMVYDISFLDNLL